MNINIPIFFNLLIGFLLLNSCNSPSIIYSKNNFNKGETSFKPYLEYKIQEFNFSTEIKYFEVIIYRALLDSNRQKFDIPLKSFSNFIFKAGKIKKSEKIKKNLLWLSKVVLKKDYFWKKRVNKDSLYYMTTSLRFLDKKNRLNAIQNQEDIKELLGEIDTEAELALWLYIIEDEQDIISYKKLNNLYRVRYKKQDKDRCLNIYYFKFYNTKGEKVKYQEIKKIPYKCVKKDALFQRSNKNGS